VKGGGLELCAGEADGWSAVSPPSLGKTAANAGKNCPTLKKAGVNTGNGLYWLNPDDPTLVFCDMSGDGVAVGDGSTKALSAPSCFELQQYYFALTKKFQKFWVAGATMACAIEGGSILSIGDGKTKASAAGSCQQILGVFGGLKNEDKRFLNNGQGQVTCFVSEDGKTATSIPPISCEAGKKTPDNGRLPMSCKEILEVCDDVSAKQWWIQAKGYDKIKVTCDFNTKSSEDGGSGWMRLYTEDLKAFSKSNCKCNTGCSFNWECDSFYSFPNSHDYEVWNNFDVQFPWTEVRGNLVYSAQCGGHNNGCGTGGGANPDNGWYGFKSDSDYNDLGAGGEGSGNKAWHRWGKPGQVIQGGDGLGWSGQYEGLRTTDTINQAGLVKGSVLRISSSSESGAPPCERFMIKTRLWVR